MATAPIYTATPPVPDARLLQRFRVPATREAAFTELVRAYSERLYWHIRRTVVSHADADDVLQTTFIKAWRGLDGFRGESALSTWLYRIATNETLSFLQSRKRRSTVPLEGSGEDATSPADRLAAEEGYDGRKAEWRLQQAVHTLPPRQQQVFNLRYFDAMPYEEMSGVTGTSVGALKASYHHAVKKIETFLKDHAQ